MCDPSTQTVKLQRKFEIKSSLYSNLMSCKKEKDCVTHFSLIKDV